MQYIHTPADPKDIKLRRDYVWCAIGHEPPSAFPGATHAEAYGIKGLETMAEFAASRLKKNEVAEGGILISMTPGWGQAMLMAAVENSVPFGFVVAQADKSGFFASGSYGLFDDYKSKAIETVIINGGASVERFMIDHTGNVLALVNPEGASGTQKKAYDYAGEQGNRRVNCWKNWMKRIRGEE